MGTEFSSQEFVVYVLFLKCHVGDFKEGDFALSSSPNSESRFKIIHEWLEVTLFFVRVYIISICVSTNFYVTDFLIHSDSQMYALMHIMALNII